jgi:acetoin utilization deacetylase AcuC-like enzyme
MQRVVVTEVPSPGHISGDHPENLQRFDLFKAFHEYPLSQNLEWLEPLPATQDEITRVHSLELLQYLEAACRKIPARREAIIDPAPTYLTSASGKAARLAAGGALAVSRAVIQGPATRGFALVRPPGHHATRETSMGFCLLNNLAIAVADALSTGGGKSFGRVAIVDFDAHHGNGTEEIFWDQERVGFFSLHQEGIYPGSGAIDEAPHARGRMVNLPLPAFTGDAGLAQITSRVIEPWLRQFAPEMLFVSAGFDGHWRDPLTNLGFSATGFYDMVRNLVRMADELCVGRVVCFLEGGYDPQALFSSTSAVLLALSGSTAAPDRIGSSPYTEPDIQSHLDHLHALHSLA